MQAGEHDAGVVGHRLVQVGAHDRPALGHQPVDGEVGAHDDPLARRRPRRRLAHDVDDAGDRSELRPERLLGIGQVRRGQLEVAVRVDETGNHHPAGEILEVAGRRRR